MKVIVELGKDKTFYLFFLYILLYNYTDNGVIIMELSEIKKIFLDSNEKIKDLWRLL